MIDRSGGDEVEVTDGLDTDRDGHPDTLVLPDPTALSLVADRDGDGLADLLLRIGPDGAVTDTDVHSDALWWPTDPAADACYDPFWTDRP
jgi:hypothetical protein